MWSSKGWMVAAVALCVAVPGEGAAQAPADENVGTVSGQVIDAGRGTPIAGVLVQIEGSDRSETNAAGFFVLRNVPSGPQRLEFSHLGYGEHSENLGVIAGEELSLTIRMSVEAIELEPFVVQARSEVDERRRSSGHGMNEINRAEIEAAQSAGLGLTELLQTSMPGTMASATSRSTTCVQYRAIRSGGRTACREVSVVLDGVMVASPSYLYSTMSLSDIERIEMLSPGQAGLRYGSGSGQAVLLIETRTGQRAQRSDASRFVTGLQWQGEEQGYRWFRVLGSSFLVNALTVGASLALADECLWSPAVGSLGLRTRCNGFNTAAIGLLSVAVPAVAGSLVAQWGGETSRTKGRLAPTALLGAMTLTGGYLLVIQGSDAAQVAGTVVLSAGVPLALALGDRIFRVLR